MSLRYNNTMKKFNCKTWVIGLLLVALMGCQNKQLKPSSTANTDAAYEAEILAMGWSQLQQSTLNHFREKSFGEAEINIKQMMAFAGADQDKWEYIRMAIVSMPEDIANQLIDRAFNKPFIKNSLDQQFAFSRVLTQLKQHKRALSVVNKVIKQDKQAEYVYWRARLHLIMEQEVLAEKDYLWLLKLAPTNPEYISQYATLLSFLDRNKEALILLQKNEQDDTLLFRQVVLLLQQNEEQTAEAKFTKLKQQTDIKALTTQQKLEFGELAYWLKDYPFSMQLLQQVKTGDQVNEAKLLMANVLVAEKNYARAAVMFHQVQNGPEQHAIPAYQLEIELHKQQADLVAALKVADMGLRMFKDDPNLLYSRAMIYAEQGEIEALEADLSQIIKDDPQNADALNALGYTWADHDMHLELAYDYIMQAHAMKPDDQAILDSVGWVHFKKGDLEQAEKYLRMAIKGNQRDSESYAHLIVVLQQQGDQQAAEEIIQMAQELFPDEVF